MKELSIEEKAKRYDDAKARMSRAFNSNRCTIGFMNEIFPELKESEDEKVRKTLIELVKCNERCGYFLINNVTTSSMLAWLEKQKSHYIFEPKFKIGDWIIVHNKDAYQVIEVNLHNYKLKHYLGGEMPFPYTQESSLRLWTIRDAKDGDVLVNQNGEMPFIFKECKNNHIYCYCGYTNRKDIFFDRFVDSEGEELHWLNLYHEQVYPATKEQRDILMKAMADAGYTFDFEKKELKTHAWSEEDEEMYKKVETAIDSYYAPFSRDAEEMSKWLKSLKERYTWLPSDEQMEVLKEATNIVGSKYKSCLNSLYSDLMKLKG